MTDPTALLALARADIKPPYTAFGILGGQETNTTAPSGIESICMVLAWCCCFKYGYFQGRTAVVFDKRAEVASYIMSWIFRLWVVNWDIFDCVGRPNDLCWSILPLRRPHR